ncbi:MAG: hypothetical protein II049_05640 [Clostridia bacterium]|nr:hypothetical protein [Clostridia bacterium]
MNKKDKVWYACYGSNLCADRFKYYIVGGDCLYNGKHYDGCEDKTMWTESRVRRFKGDLYFANVSRFWGGKGVAFFDPDGTGTVIMRLYQITYGQFLDVQQQEGPLPNWYGRTVLLGADETGIPIYTFTSAQRGLPNPPADQYLAVIREGLVNGCGIGEAEVNAYLQSAIE